MNKELNYLIEFLAKSSDKNATFYKDILSFFSENLIYTSSKYEIKTLRVLASKDEIYLEESFDGVLKHLDTFLEDSMNNTIKEAKKQLLQTLIQSNFKKKKEQFDKVETSIYKCLTSYIYGLTRGLELFYVYTLKDVKKPELFIEYGNFLHIRLIKEIFNKQERELLEDKLKEVMGVYLSVYARYLYM